METTPTEGTPMARTAHNAARAVRRSVSGCDLAQQAVRLAGDPGGEHERAVGGERPVAEPQRPQPIDPERIAVSVEQLTLLRPRHRVIGVDRPVAEVAHEEITSERAEVRWRQGQ